MLKSLAVLRAKYWRHFSMKVSSAYPLTLQLCTRTQHTRGVPMCHCCTTLIVVNLRRSTNVHSCSMLCHYYWRHLRSIILFYRDCRVVRDPQTLKSKGYGFVSFVKKAVSWELSLRCVVLFRSLFNDIFSVLWVDYCCWMLCCKRASRRSFAYFLTTST
jgi:hypothetical protein